MSGDGTKENPFEGLEGCIDFLEQTAAGALEYAKLAKEDRERLLFAKSKIRGAVDEIEKLFGQLPHEHLAQHGREELTRALFIAFEIGHAGSVQESAGAFVSEQRGSSGGQKSGKARRARRPWVPHADEIIKTFVAANPNASQDDIASEVTSGWKLENPPAPPSHSTLKNYVAEMQKAGKIQRPTR